MSKLAPIVLFVYNRLEHTEKTINALKKNALAKESDLFIFSDGSRAREQDEKVCAVRKYLKEISGFRSISVIERERNYGLANSVIMGVTEIINKYGKVIVLEDDIVCVPDFLEYMNNCLERYQSFSEVFSIAGYSYLLEEQKKGVPDTYFLKIPTSWSWATWKDRWQYFDARARGYKRLIFNYKMRKEFNYDDTYNYYAMLKEQMRRETFISVPFITKHRNIDSWAIRWYWTIFRKGGLTLFPRDSFAENIGLDGSGVHCRTKEGTNNYLAKGEIGNSFLYEDRIEEQEWIREKVKSCFITR